MDEQQTQDANTKLAMEPQIVGGPKYPPVWVFAASGFLIVVAVVLQMNVLERGDLANIFTFLAGMWAVMLPVLWMAFRSHLSMPVRTSPLMVVVGAVGVFLWFNEIRAVDGDLVPEFKRRGAPEVDEMLSLQNEIANEFVAASPDFSIRSKGDFPQFLGAGRRCEANHVELASDWNESHPKEIWKREIGAGWSGCAAVNGFLVTMEQRGIEEWTSCYRISDGKPVWVNSIETRPRHETLMGGVGPRSTPTIDGNFVYVMGATGVLRCINGATGEAKWIENILQRFGIDRADFDAGVCWGRAGSPLIVGDCVIVPAGGPANNSYKTLAAYSKDNGDLIWTSGSWQISYSSPIVAYLGGKQQIVYVGENKVSGHDVATGEVLWTYDWPGSSSTDANTSQPVLTPEGHLFVSKGYGGGAALLEIVKSEDGTWQTNELWANRRVMKTKFTNVTMHDGYVYGISDAVLECIQLSSGNRRWKRGRYGHGQLLRVNDLILLQAEEGEVVLLEANSNKHVELGRFQALEGKTWNTLCLYNDMLIARNAEQIACYQLGVKKAAPEQQVFEIQGLETEPPVNEPPVNEPSINAEPKN